MLIYNLAVMKNSKMKICTQDESRKKQRSSIKITLIVSELAQKGNLNKHWNLNKVSVKPWQGFCGFNEEPQASLIPEEVKAECAQPITLSSNCFGKTTAVILPWRGRRCFDEEPPPTLNHLLYNLFPLQLLYSHKSALINMYHNKDSSKQIIL